MSEKTPNERMTMGIEFVIEEDTIYNRNKEIDRLLGLDTIESFDVGEWVVVHALNDLVGEVTKRSLNADGEYDYMIHYEGDGVCEWCEFSDLREANDLDDWSLTGRKTMF